MTNHKHKPDPTLSLSLSRKRKVIFRRTLLIATLAIITTAIIAPPLVSSVQNIFTNLGQITEIWYNGQPIEKVVYQGQILWERIHAMQDFTTAKCNALASGQTVQLRDNRDNKVYRVRKMADGRCWMIDNLAYQLLKNDTGTTPNTGAPTYNPTAQVDTTPTGTPNLTSTNTVAQYAINTPAYNIPNNGTPTPSYLYNWCAAMADTSTNCATTVGYQAGQPATPQTGICPAPFRLPIIGTTPTPSTQGNGTNQATAAATTTNEFAKLDIWLGGTGTTRSNANTYSQWLGTANTADNWSGVLSGLYNYQLANQGENGRFWSSTAISATTSGYLLLYSINSAITPYDSRSREYGFAVRCLL